MAQRSISCISYTNDTAAKFYFFVNEYLDKHSGINGAIISSVAFQFFAYSKLKSNQDNKKDEKEQKYNDKHNRYLILTTSDADQITKDTMIAAVIQFETVIFLSTFNNINTADEEELNDIISILCANLHPITKYDGLEICGNKQIIHKLIFELKLDKLKRKEMEQNVYGLYSTKKYDAFCEERIRKSKLKLFGHLIEANADNEFHLCIINKWYPLFCADVGFQFSEESMNRMIRNMNSKKVYFWGRERVQKTEEKQEQSVEYDLVSLAAFTGYTPHMARIGFVYTPENERRKGYATHLVGCLSQIMEKENKMVWIIADKENIASNKAYTRIGFKLESNSTMFIFS